MDKKFASFMKKIFNNCLEIPDISVCGIRQVRLLEDKAKIESIDEFEDALLKALSELKKEFFHTIKIPFRCIQNDLASIRVAIKQEISDELSKLNVKMKNFLDDFKKDNAFEYNQELENCLKIKVEAINQEKNDKNTSIVLKDDKRLYRKSSLFKVENDSIKEELNRGMDELRKRVLLEVSKLNEVLQESNFIDALSREIKSIIEDFIMQTNLLYKHEAFDIEKPLSHAKIDKIKFVVNQINNNTDHCKITYINKTYEKIVFYNQLNNYLNDLMSGDVPENILKNSKIPLDFLGTGKAQSKYGQKIRYVNSMKDLDTAICIYEAINLYSKEDRFPALKFNWFWALNIPCYENVIQTVIYYAKQMSNLLNVDSQESLNAIKTTYEISEFYIKETKKVRSRESFIKTVKNLEK